MLLFPQTMIDPARSSTGQALLCTPGGCLAIQDLFGLVLIASSGLLGLLVGLSYLATARDAVSEERRRVEAEQRAFIRFARCVAAIEPTPPGRDSIGGGTALVVDAGDDGLEQVRQAYRETVMAVDHYEDDYDESLAESLAEEFGPDVATAVVNGPGYSPTLQAALVEGSRSVIRSRESLLEELNDESASLAAADDILAGVRSTVSELRRAPLTADFDVLRDRWDCLERAERACAEAVEARHQSLDERDAFGLAQYLYKDLPIPAPVLAEAGRLVGSARTQRCQMEDLLSHVG